MKQFLSFLLTLSFLPVLCQAQTETSLPDKQIMESPNIQPLPDTLKSDSAKFSIPSPVPQSSIYRPFGMYGLSPLDYGYASWELHQGFNASIGLHVTFSPSKYAPSGAGFGQDAAFMYASHQTFQCGRRSLCQQHELGIHQLPAGRYCRCCSLSGQRPDQSLRLRQQVADARPFLPVLPPA